MRAFSITLLPMLLLAVFCLIGGERLAKHEVVERTAIPKEKVSEFSKAFKEEVDRLDKLFLTHLGDIAREYSSHNDDQIKQKAEDINAVVSLYFLDQYQKPKSVVLSSAGNPSLLPEVALEGQRVLSPSKAFFVPVEYLQPTFIGKSGWLAKQQGKYIARWERPDDRRLIVVMVDKGQLADTVNAYLGQWMKNLLEPLNDNSVGYEIAHASGHLLSEHGDREGEAGMVVPFYASSDEWRLRIWEKVTVSTHYNSVTLGVAIALALLFIVCGVVFYQQQQRSIKLARRRVSFVNQVSHELGSPLTNVALNLDLALESLGHSKSQTKYRLGLISQEVERLNRLVANVLRFSHIERGKIKVSKQPCIPSDKIDMLLDSFKPALTRKGIVVHVRHDEHSCISTDADALLQIVANLISNVEKYASSGELLELSTFRRDDWYVVSVADAGPGVPEEFNEKVFESFERVNDTVSEGSSGAGLGLSIARTLAKKLSGDLQLVASDVGCRFELTLPYDSPISMESDTKKIG